MINKDLRFTEETLFQIQKAEKIAVTTHTNPDGDAIGSALALKFILNDNFDKNSEIYIDNELAENLTFLSGTDDIIIFNKNHENNLKNSDLIFILDLNNSSRLKSMEKSVTDSNAFKIMIDHHIKPENFTNLKYIDTEATSTGELIYKLSENLSLRISKTAAEALYVAIMTDTGNFRHSRTDAEIFRIAANLIEYGADPVILYENVYNQNKISSLKLLGYALESLELFHNNKISVITLPENILKKYNAKKGDIEGFVEKTLSVKKSLIGILLTKFPESNEVKISLRSKGDYCVRDIALKFDGGGHKNAAGAKIENHNISDAKKLIIQEAIKILDSK